MNVTQIFKKTGVKITVAVLCILSLTAALLSGLLVLMLLDAGGFTSDTALFDNMKLGWMSTDARNVLNCYFDPSDPTHPWRSYYDGGIYTGENSNFLYTITDTSTGAVVLATYDGKEKVFASDHGWTAGYSASESAVEDPFIIGSNVISVGSNRFYGYDNGNDAFIRLEDNISDYIEGWDVLPSDIKRLGFTYDMTGDHYEYDAVEDCFDVVPGYFETTYTETTYDLTAYLREGLPYKDDYRTIYNFASFVTLYRFVEVGILIGSGVLFLICICILLCSLGRVNGAEEPVVSTIFRLPADLTTVVCAFIGMVALKIIFLGWDIDNFVWATSMTGVLLLFVAALGVYYLSLLCVQIKSKALRERSLIGWCLRHAGMLVKTAGTAFGYIPLIWKVAVCYLGLCILELLGIMLFFWGDEAFLFLWFVEKILLGALVGYVALAFRRLKQGAQRIAAGDYGSKVSEEHLVLDFKDTAHTLNHIQDGMNAAVESRMKSERLKTELITNVSHDLKTPLTSIVSYVDLLKQEPAGSEAAKEYLEVLDRQSLRLKKLIEDLVEASKASTGNIPVEAEPLDFTMLLGQALGEYAQRLEQANLTPVVKTPEHPVMVSADGRLLWRVFDNLLGNIVKYALPGTRVYLTVDQGDVVTATFRNISREPLDMDAEELLERFVRGDASRHTEGSGLGLSIARSLVESMGGGFDLRVDGDLFKATVAFPVLAVEEETQE